MDNCIIVNGRFLTQDKTGVQRFAYEILLRLNKLCSLKVILPANAAIKPYYNTDSFCMVRAGMFSGHLWEQVSLVFLLKLRYKGALLLNFCNMAPVCYQHKISTVHDLSVLKFPEWFNKKYALLYRWFLPWVVRTSERIITVSEFSKKEIENWFVKDPIKILVAYNGFVKFNIPPAASKDEDLLIKYGIKPQQYLLAVSSLEPRKNLLTLINAFLQAEISDQTLVLVGAKGKAFNNNTEILQTNEKIIFTGYVKDEDLVNLYENALCFVYPSLYEGFGLPPLEAMGYGCPVICSAIESLEEVCGTAAVYIHPKEIQTIVDAIKKVCYDEVLRGDLKNKGLQRSLHFNWDSSAAKIHQLAMKLSGS